MSAQSTLIGDPTDYLKRHNMPKTRTCFYIPADAYVDGKGFVPSIVTENEPNHAPLVGNGNFAEPWYWGHTYEEATAQAERANAKLGLSPNDVNDIILSSMRASNVTA